MAGPTTPVDVVNRALDECGLDWIGDLEDGSKAALAATRIYDPILRQLHSTAFWNFARRENRLAYLGDITGTHSSNRIVPRPWSFMYDWPIDCVHARFVPQTCSEIIYNTVIFGPDDNPVTPIPRWPSAPSPFVVTSAPIPNDVTSEWYLTEGHDPEQTRVVLSNQLDASLIYTGLLMYPDAWDPLFEQAFVAILSARLAMPLIPDKKWARQVRMDNTEIAKQAIQQARIRDGDEGWTVADHMPDWITIRTSGIWWGGPGVLWYPWTGMGEFDPGGVY